LAFVVQTKEKELQEERYVPGAYHYFWVCDPKKRLVATAPFKDRIVHHAVYNVIEPIFDKSFIYDTYACRKGKGLHTAVERLQQFLEKKTLSTRSTAMLRNILTALITEF